VVLPTAKKTGQDTINYCSLRGTTSKVDEMYVPKTGEEKLGERKQGQESQTLGETKGTEKIVGVRAKNSTHLDRLIQKAKSRGKRPEREIEKQKKAREMKLFCVVGGFPLAVGCRESSGTRMRKRGSCW